MAYSYKGSISFGLVYIPVTLHNCIKTKDIGFNMIDKNTMSRIKYIKSCVDCDQKPVDAGDIVKGFEYEKGKYVIFEEGDFEKIKTKKDKNITIEQFVDISDIDPIYFEKPYYVVPTGAENAYVVLLNAMQSQKKAAIAKTVLGTKETLVAIRAEKGQMLLNTLYFHDEVTQNPFKQPDFSPKDAELKIAKTIIDSMTGKFRPSDYKDEYRQRVLTAIEQKVAGQEIVSPKSKTPHKIVDLMDALTASLQQLKPNTKNPDEKKAKKSTKAAAHTINKKQSSSTSASTQ